MPRLVYACQFEVSVEQGVQSLLNLYSTWINTHYARRYGIEALNCVFSAGACPPANLPLTHTLAFDEVSSSDGLVIRINWTFPDDRDQSLRWRNEVRIGELIDLCVVEHLIWIDSAEFRIAPAAITLGSPAVVRRICTDQIVRVGDMRVRATPYRFRTEGVADLVSLLANPLRRLPVVFLAPYTNDDANQLVVEDLAKKLAGVAVVAEALEAATTWELTDQIGRSLSCFDGAARIYWPGFTTEDDPRRHPLFFADRIETAGRQVVAGNIERLIFSIASFRFVTDPRLNAIVRTAEQAQRAQRVEEQKAEGGMDWETYALELDNALSGARDRIEELEAENKNLKDNQTVLFSSVAEDREDSQEPQTVPDTNKAAVDLARARFSNLIILDSAIESAEKSPFRRPTELLEALSDLDKIAHDWQNQKLKTGSGGDLLQHLIHHGWGKRCSMHISDTTRSRYGSSYTFPYSGRQTLFEPHITIGAGDANFCASIHFIMDHHSSKIVIAHVGRHLPNTKT